MKAAYAPAGARSSSDLPIRESSLRMTPGHPRAALQIVMAADDK
jgi:hypothetical protein